VGNSGISFGGGVFVGVRVVVEVVEVDTVVDGLND